MAIPPGPQMPFDPNRKYGQEPGFVSRYSGKIFIGVIVLVLLLIAILSLTALNSQEDEYATEIGKDRHQWTAGL